MVVVGIYGKVLYTTHSDVTQCHADCSTDKTFSRQKACVLLIELGFAGFGRELADRALEGRQPQGRICVQRPWRGDRPSP